MKASPVFCVCTALAATLLVLPVRGQDERRVTIVPQQPLAGSAFVVEVILPGEPAEVVVPLEPLLSGPARYTGADVRPGQDGFGLDSALVSYHFLADAAGTIDIVDLSARSGTRVLQFGSWSIEAVSITRKPATRYGSWSAPDSVLVRELFTITALAPDGIPVACPSFAVEGFLFEAVAGNPGSFRAVVLEPGTLSLPRLELGAEAGRFELRPFSIAVKDIPDSAKDASAVGGPWKLELVSPEPGVTVMEDEVVAWELRASGPGWPGLAAAPELTVLAPDGSNVPADAGLANSGRTGTAPGSFTGLRGTFRVRGPGMYTIRPLPYAWLDATTRTVRQAVAPPVRIMVAPAAQPAWNVPEPVVALARTRIAALATRDAAWIPASEAATRGDWTATRLEAYQAAGISDVRGDLSSASLHGRGSAEKAFAAAAATLVATSALPDSFEGLSAADRSTASTHAAALRAEALAVFLRLEREAFPVRGSTTMADAAAASFGNLDRVSSVLPPAGWMLVVGLACVVVAAALGALVHSTRAPRGRTLRVAALCLAAVSVVVFGLAVLSVLERASPRFVSLGGTARAVPSALAAEAEAVGAGRMGLVLESTAEWSFVELDQGRAVWLSAHDVAGY